MLPQAPLYQDQECGLLCRPPRGRESFVTIFRLGSFHIVLDIALLFVTYLFLHLWYVAGIFIFISFVCTIIGSSIAVCCCPTENGWRANVALQTISYITRGVDAVAILAKVFTTNKHNTVVAGTACKSIVRWFCMSIS